MTLRRRLKNLRSLSSCWITRLKNSKETLGQENWRSKNWMSRLTRWDRNWSTSTESIKTWLWLWMIWEWDKKVWPMKFKIWDKHLMIKKPIRRNLKMMYSRYYITSQTSKSSRRVWLDFIRNMWRRKSRMNRETLIFIGNMLTRGGI